MNSNLIKAKDILNEGNYTLVLCNEKESITSTDRGVKPLIMLIDNGKDYSDYSSCDKVVGRAAAYLYVLLGVKKVYALTLSEGAREVFENYGITYYYDKLVPNIINRSGDGLCPMEKATLDATSPQQALEKVREKLKQLQK